MIFVDRGVASQFHRLLAVQSRNPDVVKGVEHGFGIALRPATELARSAELHRVNSVRWQFVSH